MKILTTLKYCPVTGNIPMTCTEDGFLESCKRFRKMMAFSGGSNLKFTYCADCKGKQRPKNLTIISLVEAQSAREKQENDVGANKTMTNKKCESCGKIANLRNVHKKNVCPSCATCRTMVSTRPEMVVEVLKEFGHHDDPATGGDVTEANEIIKALRLQLSQSDRQLASVIEELKDEKKRAEQLTDANAKLRSVNIQLKESGSNAQGTDIDLQALAWRIAEGMIYGDISGIEVEDLRLLRGLQEKR